MSNIPEFQHINNTKVANYISAHTGLVTRKPYNKDIRLKTGDNKSKAVVVVNLIEDENITLSNPNITQEDRAILEAVCSIYENGSLTFHPEQIARTLRGSENITVTQEMVDAINESLYKLSVTRIRINSNGEHKQKEVEERQKKNKVGFFYESYLLPIDRASVRLENGKFFDGYKLLCEPALYTYAVAKGHLLTFPTSLLLSDKREDSEEVMIRRYVIKRIRTMKNMKNNADSNIISYSWYDKDTKREKGALVELGYNPEAYKNWRSKKRKIHKVFMAVLDDMIKKGEISRYEIRKSGQKITGFELFWDNEIVESKS